MSNYTKGSWKIQEGEGLVFDILSPKGLEVCFCSRTNPLDAEANARLISAAPELLEACKLLDKWLMNFSPDAVNKDYWKLLKQAVAKAEPTSQEGGKV